MSDTPIQPGAGAVALAGVAVNALLLTAGYTPGFQLSGDPLLATWANIPNGIYGVPIMLGAWNRASFGASGTFGVAGSVQIEGSNDLVNWFKLSPAARTSAGLFAALGVNEMPLYVRPHVTAGDGTSAITVTGWFT